MRQHDDRAKPRPPSEGLATSANEDATAPATPRGRATSPPKRERSAALTQERILDAAEQEFAARGYQGARLREIALGAGVQPALIHHYFADKQGLYEAVIHRAVDQMSTASWRVLETEKGLEGIVRGFVDVMVDFSEAHQNLLAIMRSEVLAGVGNLVDVVRDKTQALLEAVVQITQQLQGAGDLRPDIDPREMVRSGLSLILYPIVDAPVLELLLPDSHRDAEVTSSERRKRVITEVLLGGIRKRA
ncbi:MAG: TetR/AcrR family transcriptional regulator [Polyangiaceae bacterium]